MASDNPRENCAHGIHFLSYCDKCADECGQCGATRGNHFAGCKNRVRRVFTQADINAAVRDAVAAEREACARHVDDADEGLPKHMLAAEIRARAAKGEGQ